MSGSGGYGTAAVVSTLEYTDLGQLINAFRQATDDNAVPPLWADDEITRYANDTVRDAVERGFLIEDDQTPEICQIAVVANTANYPLDPRILKITRARLDVRRRVLFSVDKASLDNGVASPYHHLYGGRFWGPSWDTAKGIVFGYIENTAGIRLVRIPTENDVLMLTVYRLPLSDMVELSDEPEIKLERRYDLLDGMLARGYLKHDSETYDAKLAAEHEAKFTQHFGVKIDASVRKKQREPRSNVVRAISF
jgi:hypothetical protein